MADPFSVEVPGLTAVYTPIDATADRPANTTHWDIQRVGGDSQSGPAPLTQAALAAFAATQESAHTLPLFVYRNPSFTRREVQWVNQALPLPYWVK